MENSLGLSAQQIFAITRSMFRAAYLPPQNRAIRFNSSSAFGCLWDFRFYPLRFLCPLHRF
jgi:hypothetical protein